MTDFALRRLQLAVFGLVTACFTNIYITQPVLPVLQEEFQATSVTVSFTIGCVIALLLSLHADVLRAFARFKRR